MKNILILVDLQNDFLPGGALAVADGDAVLPVINRLLQNMDHVVATQDWHPANHGSFASNHPGRSMGDVIELAGLPQVLWPDHCVQETEGARFAPALETARIEAVFPKGTDPEIDSYSGFFDNGHRRATGLGDYLEKIHAENLYIAGLATDYCVKATALDAVRLSYRTLVITDACRGVELHEGDLAAAFEAMKAAGVELITSDQFPTPRHPA